MRKKIYVKPCLVVIVIGDLCDTDPSMYVGTGDVDAGGASAKQNNFYESGNENDSVRNFNLWDEDE